MNKKIFKISLIFIYLSLKLYEKEKDFIIKEEIKLIKKYYKINNNGNLIKRKNNKKNEYPKVSIISSVYNREKYIPRFVRSIQNQEMNDIELIFIDDCSDDKSIRIIENYMKNDERIILIKNKKNKGTLISRNIGALKAKGLYLIFPDSDDIISKNILDICYEICQNENYDIIRFNIYSNSNFIFSLTDNILKRTIYQPELRTYLIYGYGYPKLVDGIISNKFISKKTYLISLNNIDEYYLNQKMIYFEDGLMNFALHLNSRSLYLLNHIGYYYIYNQDSVSHFVNFDLYLRCFFVFLKFFIKYTKNNKYEQKMKYFILQEYIYDINLLYKIDNYSSIYEEVINSLMNSEFISPIDMNKLKIMKEIIKLKWKSRNAKKEENIKFHNQ